MTYYHVHSVEQDLAGKWYARVVITETEAQFFKFNYFPTMEEIQAAAANYIEAQNKSAASEIEGVLTNDSAE